MWYISAQEAPAIIALCTFRVSRFFGLVDQAVRLGEIHPAVDALRHTPCNSSPCRIYGEHPIRLVQAAKAASTYKRQDEAPLTASEMKSADGSALAPVLATRDAGEVCAKKRTRKNSLALLNYSKIRDQEKQSENGESDTPEDRSTARWRLAREPESIHEPPPLCTQGGRSCLKENNPQGVHRKPKSPVRFDEGSLLPSESSSDEG